MIIIIIIIINPWSDIKLHAWGSKSDNKNGKDSYKLLLHILWK